MAKGWTRSFERPGKPDGRGFVARLLEGLARIHEQVQEEQAHRELRRQMRELFRCEDISLFVPDPDAPPRPGDGDWSLKVVCGWGLGNVVSQSDLGGAPGLVPGKPAPPSMELAKQGMLKAIALAYEEDRPWGLDVEEDGLVLLREPVPSDDLGSGDLSILALPIRHRRRVGRVIEECAPVGVLALYRTPTTIDLAGIERPLTTLLAGALADTKHPLQDPITTLFGESFLRQELERQLNLRELLGARAVGGLVVGVIDALSLHRHALEASPAVDPAAVSRHVSRLLREVGACVRRRAAAFPLGGGREHRCGYAARIGVDGFGVLLPALGPVQLCRWASALQHEVRGRRFDIHDVDAREVTVSLRVIPFGPAPVADAVWATATAALGAIVDEQRRVRADPAALRGAVSTLLALDPGGRWVPPRALERAPPPELDRLGEAERPTRAYEVDGVGTLLDEDPTSADDWP